VSRFSSRVEPCATGGQAHGVSYLAVFDGMSDGFDGVVARLAGS